MFSKFHIGKKSSSTIQYSCLSVLSSSNVSLFLVYRFCCISSILQENLDAHVKRCPMQKQVQALQMQPFFKKGVNSGKDDEIEGLSSKSAEANFSCSKPCSESSDITSEMKRNAIYQMSVPEFSELLKKIQSIHSSISSNIQDSYAMPEACNRWLKKQVDRYELLLFKMVFVHLGLNPKLNIAMNYQ